MALSGKWVLFRFAVGDTGMRRLAMVAPTQAGRPVKAVAEVFEVHPNYLSMLRNTAASRARTGWSRRWAGR